MYNTMYNVHCEAITYKVLAQNKLVATVIPPCSSALGLLFHAVYNIHTGSRHSIRYTTTRGVNGILVYIIQSVLSVVYVAQ